MFRTNRIQIPNGKLFVGIFVGPDFYYKAVIPLSTDLVEARIKAKKILEEGWRTLRGDVTIPSSELAHCYITTETEMISKRG